MKNPTPDLKSIPPLVMVAHGSRREEARHSIDRLRDLVVAIRPGLQVFASYIELCDPLFPSILRELSQSAIIVPLLLTHGFHLATDVRAVAYENGFETSEPLGPDSKLIDLLNLRLKQAGTPDDASIILAAAGSKDKASNKDVELVAQALSRLRGVTVKVGFIGSAMPNFFEVARKIQDRNIAVSPYLLSPGKFSESLANCGMPWIAEPLGIHQLIAQLILDRYDHTVRCAGITTTSMSATKTTAIQHGSIKLATPNFIFR